MGWATGSMIPDGWPVLVGVVCIGVSCALLKDPPDLSAESDLSDIFDVGSFEEATGTITEGGTVAGSWEGACEIYGYPYQLELELVGGGDTITGDGVWSTGWGTFPGEISGYQTDGGVELVLDIEYYGYPLYMDMSAEFVDGTRLEGQCSLSYGSMGTLQLDRLFD